MTLFENNKMAPNYNVKNAPKIYLQFSDYLQENVKQQFMSLAF